MAVSRRSFLSALGAGSAALAIPTVSARGREAATGWREWSTPLRLLEGDIRLDSNENPYGPASSALEAIRGMFSEAPRYPGLTNDRLISAISSHISVPTDSILLGSGSGEILRMSVDAFTDRERGLVTAAPTFELPTDRATVLGVPVTAVPVDDRLRLDLDSMASASTSAGLVFLCNPNNPTATVHGGLAIRKTIERILRMSSDTIILVDEAYHEYVDDPAYETMIPLALREPRVVVARTFSKVYGLAGLRVGYAVGAPNTLERMAVNILPNNVNVLAGAAASASLETKGHARMQATRNQEARRFTLEYFTSRGFTATPSQTNFVMVDLRQEMRPFREACRGQGVLVGRPFPPLLTHVRISIGTADEMQRAVEVFGRVLS
ncbi:MAG: aminotransferase class I/II-fold pyridoxal phosphate-dependent enzyme [Gemmatimonadales bacterium]|nr:MAG: aminotransferase class I/II-fold pyridoxal phosphate-dependent enzyme [Gemmatimonadales bacterium]